MARKRRHSKHNTHDKDHARRKDVDAKQSKRGREGWWGRNARGLGGSNGYGGFGSQNEASRSRYQTGNEQIDKMINSSKVNAEGSLLDAIDGAKNAMMDLPGTAKRVGGMAVTAGVVYAGLKGVEALQEHKQNKTNVVDASSRFKKQDQPTQMPAQNAMDHTMSPEGKSPALALGKAA